MLLLMVMHCFGLPSLSIQMHQGLSYRRDEARYYQLFMTLFYAGRLLNDRKIKAACVVATAVAGARGPEPGAGPEALQQHRSGENICRKKQPHKQHAEPHKRNISRPKKQQHV
jgi:hypothetical protein